MKAKEAKELMKTAPQSETKKSKVNPALTEKQAFDCVNNWLQGESDNAELSHLSEKRVYQIIRKQRRPRF